MGQPSTCGLVGPDGGRSGGRNGIADVLSSVVLGPTLKLRVDINGGADRQP